MRTYRNTLILTAFAVLLLAALACRVPGQVEPTTPPPPPAEPTQPPPMAPTQPPAPEATLAPQPTLAPPPADGLPEPVGFAYASEADPRVKIRWFENGQDLIVEQARLAWANPNNLHIAGSMPSFDSGLRPPVIFFQPDTASLKAVYYDDSVIDLASDSGFYGMAGAPGDSAYAYNSIGYDGTSTVSRLRFSMLENAPNVEEWLRTTDSDWFVIHPLAVQGDGGRPWKVWFTRHAYGIGGDIVFAPMRGLFSIDQASKSVVQVLGDDRMLSGLSDDQAWAASIPLNHGESGAFSLRLHELASGRTLEIPAGAQANRGAGNAVFSPGNALVAWMEGNGYRMAEVPDFTATVRVARNDGSLVLEKAGSEFDAAVGFSGVSDARPVAWMTQNLVLVEVHATDWITTRLVTLDANDGTIRPVAEGGFLGLVYP